MNKQSIIDEITPLAKEIFTDSNCEAGHDVENWRCAERIVEQKHRIQVEIEKAAKLGYFQSAA